MPRGKVGAVSAEWALVWPEQLDQTRSEGRTGEDGGSNLKAVRRPLQRSRDSAMMAVPGWPKWKSWVIDVMTDAADVSTISAAVGTLIAIATAIHGWFKLRLDRQANQARLQLEKEKQQHETRLKYLDRAIQTDLKEEDRSLVLNFVAETSSSDSALRMWARREQEKVEEAARLRKDVIKTEQALHSLRLEASKRNANRAEQEARLKAETARFRKQLREAEERASVQPHTVSTTVDDVIVSLRETFRGDVGWIYDREGYGGGKLRLLGDRIYLDPSVYFGMTDWETVAFAYKDLLTAEQIEAVRAVAGLRGDEAREALDSSDALKSVHITQDQASKIFAVVVKPYWDRAVRRFPMLTSDETPSSAQTALLSLVFNMGPRQLDVLEAPLAEKNWGLVADSIEKIGSRVAADRRRDEANLIRAELGLESAQ